MSTSLHFTHKLSGRFKLYTFLSNQKKNTVGIFCICLQANLSAKNYWAFGSQLTLVIVFLNLNQQHRMLSI